MLKVTDIPIKSVYAGKTTLNNVICHKDLCRRVMGLNPSAEFYKTFYQNLKKSEKSSEPIYVIENPFYLSMIEKMKHSAGQYGLDWLFRHINMRFHFDIDKKPLIFYMLKDQNKSDYIKFFSSLRERMHSCSIYEFDTWNGDNEIGRIDNEVGTLLKQNSYYQKRFDTFIKSHKG